MELGPEPINVTTNLDAQEIDVHYSLQKYWGEVQKLAVEMFTDHGVDDVIAEEVAILPGLEEGASLLWLAEFAKNDSYDVVVIDAAPTAETLRLLTLPDAARWWIQKLLPLGQKPPGCGAWVWHQCDRCEPLRRLQLSSALTSARACDSSTSSMRLS
jgi:arsenite-transporting ATPase